VDLAKLKGKGEFFITHIQEDEINNTKNNLRRNSLHEIFTCLYGIKLPTESAVWDISRWGECKWGDENYGLYEQIKKN
jgi:hypothetical protein